jgi:hypothetical protein
MPSAFCPSAELTVSSQYSVALSCTAPTGSVNESARKSKTPTVPGVGMAENCSPDSSPPAGTRQREVGHHT